MEQISPVEFWSDYRCETIFGYFNIQGIPRHQCVLNCVGRENCEFLNYNAMVKSCELGTGMCIQMTRSNSTELIIFGSMDRVMGLRRIQLRQYDNISPLMSDGTTNKLAQLVTDKYMIPGIMKPTRNFEGPCLVDTGVIVIESSDPDEIYLFSSDDEYTLHWLPGYTEGDPIDERAVVAGYKKMEDGTIAKLYILSAFGSVRYYNSVTKLSYNAYSEYTTQSTVFLMIVKKR